jgi:chromosome segregation protein
MFFKQIEMMGFKSFADRTLVNLESGMTSIVGPNGCGKSNILDAMRWALGEQRPKELRGAHMQDVIFNGSDERAATGMAEVTLTFDNAESRLPLDFAEVQVTRRIYRSGESEYLINKAPCRLKDVQELFMDTGIGTNAYSMIGQGKISMVLSSKPDDRRYLFEEASGIIKYKSRKRVAMRKLDQAEQNLLRLGDIIMEVERQMRSLKRQVNAAIRYRELSDLLRDTEIRAAWIQQVALTATITDLRTRFQTAQKAFEEDSAQMTALEARYEELNLAKLEVDRVLHARREGVHDIDTEMEKIEGRISLIKSQAAYAKEQQQRAGEEGEALRQQAAQTQKDLELTNGRAKELRQSVEGKKAGLEAENRGYETAVAHVAAADEELEQVRAKSVETMNLRAKTEISIETFNVSIVNTEAQLQAIYGRQEREGQRHESLAAELDSLQRAEREKGDRATALSAERAGCEDQVLSLSGEMNALNESRQTLRETRSSVEARLTSLRELRDSYEGFAAGVRSIMRAKKNGNDQAAGVVGPIGDLLSTSIDYETAVEAALGGNVNNIVVEAADSAKVAIEYLRDNKAGRVTFLPLDTIRPGGRNDLNALQGRPGVIGAVLDLVQFDESYREAMEYVFHNTVVVKSIDDAIAIAQTKDRFPRIVTLDGEVVTSSGAVTGGRTAHQKGGLIGRSAEIAELEGKVEATDGEIRVVAEKGSQITDLIEKQKTQSGDLASQEKGLRAELTELSVGIARNTTELKSLSDSAEGLKAEREALVAKRESMEAERREEASRATDFESEDARLQESIATAQEAASAARQAQSELGSRLSDLRIELAGAAQTLEEVERDQSRLRRELETAQSEGAKRLESIKELREQETALEENIKDEVERSKALSESKEEARKHVVEAENQRQALLDESDTLEKDLKGLRESTRSAQSEVHQLEISLRHDEDQLGFFQERILTEYNIALGSLAEEDVGTDEYDDETREEIVKDTRGKLEHMSAVNLTAIEEFDALTERNDFLVSQNNDLSQAREALLDVVERIDATIKELFLDTFNTVADHFRQYFRRLFNGGQARIYLLDEDDPLESGIEIEARPPGKKPQTISLLSGGEQALTAIALLFSIFKAKPSPFCVLDEVDAPLDDANIGRFLNMLDEFCEDTQFVVITHSKQTMAKAGSLYGVTQQDRGVSQLVSVKLDEVRLKAEPAA